MNKQNLKIVELKILFEVMDCEICRHLHTFTMKTEGAVISQGSLSQPTSEIRAYLSQHVFDQFVLLLGFEMLCFVTV